MILPAFPGIPLRIPAKLGRDLRRLSWCSFSIDRYLFLMCAGITRFSKSLLWIFGTSSSPSFWSRVSFMSLCVKALDTVNKAAAHKTQARRKSIINLPNWCLVQQGEDNYSSREAQSEKVVPWHQGALINTWPSQSVIRILRMRGLGRGNDRLSQQKCDIKNNVHIRTSEVPYFKRQLISPDYIVSVYFIDSFKHHSSKIVKGFYTIYILQFYTKHWEV